MAGQATETLQGGAQNENRPQAYRHLFQAYGTYVLPVGKGLTVDFGKWASALGPEGNYTKDQINYSRSYFFNFLPFYHMGFRNTYALNDKLSLSYWLVNGVNQTEDFNGFKSQLGQAVIKPTKNLSWTINYYNGQEQRDLNPAFNPALPSIPSQPGLSTSLIRPIPRAGSTSSIPTRFGTRRTNSLWAASSTTSSIGSNRTALRSASRAAPRTFAISSLRRPTSVSATQGSTTAQAYSVESRRI